MLTRVLSRSRMSRKASKSEYRLRTIECCTLNAGMLVWGVSPASSKRKASSRTSANTHHAHYLVVGEHPPSDA